MIKQALETLEKGAWELGVKLTGAQLSQFVILLEELKSYNQHTNLVANADEQTVVQDHVLNSLSLVLPIEAQITKLQQDKEICSLVDIGTGAGFPGLPLAIACENLAVTLVESIGKKARFLDQVVSSLKLNQRVKVMNCRAELLAKDPLCQEVFSFATSRAVGPVDVVAELSLPFLVIGGLMFVPKSNAQLKEEVARAKRSFPQLKAQLQEVINPKQRILTKDHVIMVVEKLGHTPSCYPRSAAQIKHNPLGVL